MEGAPLPPGETGLPLLGETITLLKNGFAFVEAGARKHGPIFKTNIFFRPTAVITGPNAAKPQDLDLDWSRVPPEPRDGLRAAVNRRAEIS